MEVQHRGGGGGAQGGKGNGGPSASLPATPACGRGGKGASTTALPIGGAAGAGPDPGGVLGGCGRHRVGEARAGSFPGMRAGGWRAARNMALRAGLPPGMSASDGAALGGRAAGRLSSGIALRHRRGGRRADRLREACGRSDRGGRGAEERDGAKGREGWWRLLRSGGLRGAAPLSCGEGARVAKGPLAAVPGGGCGGGVRGQGWQGGSVPPEQAGPLDWREAGGPSAGAQAWAGRGARAGWPGRGNFLRRKLQIPSKEFAAGPDCGLCGKRGETARAVWPAGPLGAWGGRGAIFFEENCKFLRRNLRRAAGLPRVRADDGERAGSWGAGSWGARWRGGACSGGRWAGGR